jgi:hypothetical protein
MSELLLDHRGLRGNTKSAEFNAKARRTQSTRREFLCGLGVDVAPMARGEEQTRKYKTIRIFQGLEFAFLFFAALAAITANDVVAQSACSALISLP